jgi:endonuclease-3
VEEIVHPTGFFRNKTKNIIGAAQRIVAEYDGRVPDTMDDLLTLPGVARKTANIVLYNAFGKAEGIAVDTHVFRLAHRLGYSSEKDANKVERDLMALFPREQWGALTYRLIEHGRAICDAKRPICAFRPVPERLHRERVAGAGLGRAIPSPAPGLRAHRLTRGSARGRPPGTPTAACSPRGAA